MKKILFLILALSVLVTDFSCKKKVDDAYPNPETVNPPTGNLFAGYFTGMLYTWKLYVQDYGENWWEEDLGAGMFAQTHERYVTSRYSWYSDYSNLTDGENGNGFQGSSNGIQSQWNACYTKMKDWSTMQVGLKGMSAADQTDVLIYYQLATVMKDVWCARLVDFFNKIPYFDAFKGNQGVYFPKYDDPKAVYDSVLVDLQNISIALPLTYGKMSTAGKALFVNQDVAFSGDVSKWVQYINSQRLKFGIRISGVDAANAQTAISGAIANLPTADMDFSTHTTDTPPGGGLWLRGVYESARISFIPNVIEKRMNFGNLTYEPAIDDPRLPAIGMPTKFGDFRGMTMNADTNEVYYNAPRNQTYYNGYDNATQSLASNARSMYNIVTFPQNEPNFPAKMWTLAEQDLFLAEAELKGIVSTGKSAGQHINDAVVHSSNYWYRINGLNAGYRSDLTVLHPAKSDVNIASYANKVQALFESQTSLENKMEVIMQQKYIHLNISDSYELWTELRRTRHPLLEPMVFAGKVNTPQPERLTYPTSELQTNSAQLLKVNSDNNFINPIFWVPSTKVGSSWYGTFLGPY